MHNTRLLPIEDQGVLERRFDTKHIASLSFVQMPLLVCILGIVSLFSMATRGFAQDRPSSTSLPVAPDRPPSTPADTAQVTQQKVDEWLKLTSTLEPRLAGLLPCDPRIRVAVEEVSKASDERLIALTAYWEDVSKRSKEQLETAHKLVAENNARAFCEIARCESMADWKADQADSEEEQTRMREKTSELRDSAQQQQALAVAARTLNGISQTTTTNARQAAIRMGTATNLDTSLNALLTAAQARQAAVESQLSSLSTEKNLWSGYYEARIGRAQLECSITSSGPGTAPRTQTKKGK